MRYDTAMVDIKFIREHADEVKDAAAKKNMDPGVIDELLKVDEERRALMTAAEAVRAEVPDAQGGLKFYAIFNPELERMSKDTVVTEEGCLSVPGAFGDVPRSRMVTLKGLDKNGRPVKIKAWGLLARVFQHECDHLDGKLFLDRAKNVYQDKA